MMCLPDTSLTSRYALATTLTRRSKSTLIYGLRG
jgi:hypothetical protein